MKINLDSPILLFLSTVADFMILNILFILCCAPIVTIGPAVSALYSVTMREARHEGGYICKSFFKAFKNNFKQSFALSVLCILTGGLLAYGIRYWWLNAGTSTASHAILIVAGILVLCYVMAVLYIFPLNARFDNTVAKTVKNALLLAIFNLKETILLVLITAAVVVLMIFTSKVWIFMMVGGFAACAYLKSFLLVKVFKRYEPEGEKPDESETAPASV